MQAHLIKMKTWLLLACIVILLHDGTAWLWHWKGMRTTNSVCQNHKMNLKCWHGTVIKIHYANYGRTDYYTCPRGHLLTDDCVNKRTKKIAKRLCNGKRRCKLKASSRMFGNSCRGTTKYLEVTFSCVDPDDDKRNVEVNN
ncbi:L-rhamnose-binding lectin CSL1-like [Saccostrea echinata]|uniref:L-rhamnose-binding lectin CSL1-like n=1 Tax=Saccostrea echinata TaxID=191078 RepID=UPI002A81534D|nr:L-rhamnose-binding lectin CSL1-like [Saccostrea echinata]